MKTTVDKMKEEIKHGYKTLIDSDVIIDEKLPKKIEKCKYCHTNVTATMKWGYNETQIMCFHKCPNCLAEWHYDLKKRENVHRLQNNGLMDEQGQLTNRFHQLTKDRRGSRKRRPLIKNQPNYFV